MKKDIAIIRESITKVVALLTKRAIKVTQRGSRAYVQYNARTGAIELVNLPYMPDDATEEFVAAVQGFLDHEVGHVLFTDPKIMPTLKKESAKVKNLANAIEDVYIERKMADAFAGSVGNLNAVRRFYLNKIAKPKIDEALLAGDMNAAAGYAGLVQFRAWGGQQMAIDFLNDNPSYAELNKPLADKLGPELIAKVRKANNSWECLDLAREMKKKLEEKSPESEAGPDKSDEGKPSKSSSGKPDAPSDEVPDENHDETAEEGDDADKPDADDEGTTRAETDDSDKKRDESSKADTEPDEAEAGDSDGDTGGDREESDEEEEGDDDQEEKPSGEDGEHEEAADSFGSGSVESEDEDSEESDESRDADAGEGEDTTEANPDDATTKGTDGDSKEEDLSDRFEEERDFDDDLSRALSAAAVSEIRDSTYQIFSTDWDEVEPAPKAKKESSIEKMVDRTQHMIATIQKGLERSISAKARKAWIPGQRRGRIAPGSLFRTAVGDDRVFRQRYETQAKNTAVSLLVDCSGSMGWSNKIQTAGYAAFALSSTLERLKITHEVIGFTTRSNRAMSTAIKAEGMGVTYARTESLYMPVFKGFNERLTTDAKSRMAHLTENDCTTWLRENVDGESLQIAARRLKTQRAERHLLIVLSDGSPACPGNYWALESHLKKVAAELEKHGGVEVIGIGIQDENVSRFYDKHVILQDLDDLPTTVVGQLAKVLLAP